MEYIMAVFSSSWSFLKSRLNDLGLHRTKSTSSLILLLPAFFRLLEGEQKPRNAVELSRTAGRGGMMKTMWWGRGVEAASQAEETFPRTYLSWCQGCLICQWDIALMVFFFLSSLHNEIKLIKPCLALRRDQNVSFFYFFLSKPSPSNGRL